MKNTVGLIGFGRMGGVLSQLLLPDFDIYVFDKKIHPPLQNGVMHRDLNTVLKQKIIFIAVPIRDFENAVRNISPLLSNNTTIVDLCSVKLHPVQVMKRYLPSHVGIIAAHPLFGPDSIKLKSNLRMMMHPEYDIYKKYQELKYYFSNKNITILEMTPDDHDRQIARSQGITHFIGRALKNIDAKSTLVDTLGFQKLLDVMEKTNNDSLELFYDLQNFNPYATGVMKELISEILNIEHNIKNNNFK